ncbi:MAG: divergent PAP2 family protein [Lachnospiraceae bacterium]|jgi:acid phosphatase family membrane protein YuiD|nr:divergent PAP2 family protein [Lachnospiraceae bacterium]MCR5499043.1 divergent PAP2 family protein [Acetatifactor sp.]MBP5263928.1 divergent PAP2 family protein [Lachnospiraceae bacterium]MBP5733512.1 divergent PAP2 family protein [Lachnospiraceae bacterium]MBQ6094674.1 divergent PAP2 family protein [Lachnospiraceae bacterium]
MYTLFDNAFFLSAAAGWLVAQVLKTLIHMFFTKKFIAERLIGSGGMPSSHSASVCALATAACMRSGVDSFEFAISLVLALIVMYDAMGVRRETGIQAKLINEMLQAFEEMGNSDLPTDEKLKEFVGHTPLQVMAGAILGIVIAVVICNILP